MNVDNQKLVMFLDNIMGCGLLQTENDQSVVKDATEREMIDHCDIYACIDCPIIKRCSMADNLYNYTF